MSPRSLLTAVVSSLVIMAAAPCVLGQTTVTVPASRDNTLYESIEGTFSNGAGPSFFVGSTQFMVEARRGLIKFDLTAHVPAGSVVESVELRLHMSRTISGPRPVRLHRALADWGEGNSIAFGEGGGGAPAAPGDATWIHRFSPGIFWNTMGGDFASTASATTDVDQMGFYTWSSAGMVADVQAWANDPGSNFGWFLIGNEVNAGTAKRFDSREHLDPSVRPALIVTLAGGSSCEADWNDDEVVNSQDISAFITSWLNSVNLGTLEADFNGDEVVNSTDISAFITVWLDEVINGC